MVIACAHSETKLRRGPERRAKLSSSLEEKPEVGYSPSQGWREHACSIHGSVGMKNRVYDHKLLKW